MSVPQTEPPAPISPRVFHRPPPRPRRPTADLKRRAADWVAANPAAGLGASAVAGAVVGWLFKRR